MESNNKFPIPNSPIPTIQSSNASTYFQNSLISIQNPIDPTSIPFLNINNTLHSQSTPTKIQSTSVPTSIPIQHTSDSTEIHNTNAEIIFYNNNETNTNSVQNIESSTNLHQTEKPTEPIKSSTTIPSQIVGQYVDHTLNPAADDVS